MIEAYCCQQLENFKSHAYTHCRTEYWNFSEGTRIANKSRGGKKKHSSDLCISAIAEKVQKQSAISKLLMFTFYNLPRSNCTMKIVEIVSFQIEQNLKVF